MLPASTLARRKATVAASARRRAPRLAPPAEEPRAIMAGYVSRLSGVVNALHSETLAALRDEGVRVDAADGDAPLQPGAAQRVEARLRRLAEKIVGDRKTIATIEGVGASVYRFSREQWSRQVKASLGIDLTSDPNLDELARVFRAENTKLIKSLCASHVERVRDVLMGAGSGERVENIMRDIREATGASKSRAALIARDQVLSLNGDVAEARHKDLGVTEYVWRTSKDERVRERHRELDGQRISYAEPPIVDKRTGRREHAGRDFQCRCTADPIIDLDALALKQPAPVPPQRPTAAPVAEAPPPVVSAAAPPRAFKLQPRPAAAPEPPRQPAPPAPPRAPAVDVPSAAKTLPPPAVAAAEPAPVFAIPPPPRAPVFAEPATASVRRVRYSEPLPPPRDIDADEVVRTGQPIANPTAPSVEAMPIDRTLEGVDIAAHQNARAQYPTNRIGDTGFDDHVAAEAAEAFKAISPDAVKALSRYTGSAYKSINGFLRYGEEVATKRFGAKAVAEAPSIIKGATEAIEALPKAPEDMVLFRGALFRSVEGLDELAAASEFESKTFLSTSRDPKVAAGFGGGEFGDDPSAIYRIKKHSTGAVLPRTHSNPAEAEVLFPPGARFRIVGRQRVSPTQLVLDVEEIT